MKVNTTIVVRGRVGEQELAPGPWLDGIADSLSMGQPAIAFKRSDGTIAHGKLVEGSATVNAATAMIHCEVEIDEDDVVQAPPHGSLGALEP
jgi:hypothetical protein